MTLITDIKARQIFDSRGIPTVEVDVLLETGVIGRAAVPSGASTGSHEALELRDNDKDFFQGKGVSKAIQNVNTEIAQVLKGADASNQIEIDTALMNLDGTNNKGRLGANAILGVSLAVARASALYYGMPLYRYVGGLYGRQLPMPLMNVINGGCHADNGLDFQEFMIAPVGGTTFSESLEMGAAVFHALKGLLKKKHFSINVGDEGGFAPGFKTAKEALDFLTEAVGAAGLKIGDDIMIALDVASSEFFKNGKYHVEGKALSSEELVGFYEKLAEDYHIFSIEDGMAEDDWEGWRLLTEHLGHHMQLVGDDVFVTNSERLSRGIEEGIANAILIKPNQIGTLTETAYVIDEAKAAGYQTIMSHRSGETEDTTIADLAVAFNCGQIKTGSLSRTDRVAKYNRLLRIEEELTGDHRHD